MDNDLISREALRRDLIDNYSFYPVMVKNAIAKQPVIDAVEVVRCKDCKHYIEHRTRRNKQLMRFCTRMARDGRTFHVKPDDFCSAGKRREENA